MKKVIFILSLFLTNLLFAYQYDPLKAVMAYDAQKKGDYKKASVLWKQSCDEGNANGCFNLGSCMTMAKVLDKIK